MLFGLAVAMLIGPTLSLAKEKPKEDARAPSAMTRALGSPQFPGLPADLPKYVEPESYSVDLAVKSPGSDITMKRAIDRGRIRTEFETDGQTMVMIELGDEKGTQYMLMPSDKRAIKQTRTGMEAMAKQVGHNLEEMSADPGGPPADVKIEDLGSEKIADAAARKIRFSMESGTVVAWFDPASGAPLRMESDAGGQKSTMEWKNFKSGPQPAALFEVPKKYEVTDMDEMMAQMKSLQGGPGSAQLSALMGSSGVAGMAGMGGGLNGIAGQMGQNFGSSMGSSFGGALGGALGGPLGAIAGQYLGGKVGGAIGKKAAEVVTPGK